MKTIEVDEEVYEAIESRALVFIDQSPNDVLRRILLADDDGNPSNEVTLRDFSPPPPRRVPRKKTLIPKNGALIGLIKAGLIHPGDVLIHERKRTGERFAATVTAHGWIEANGKLYANPSPALKSFVSTEIDGWAFWVHTPSEKSLRVLRAELDETD